METKVEEKISYQCFEACKVFKIKIQNRTATP